MALFLKKCVKARCAYANVICHIRVNLSFDMNFKLCSLIPFPLANQCTSYTFTGKPRSLYLYLYLLFVRPLHCISLYVVIRTLLLAIYCCCFQISFLCNFLFILRDFIYFTVQSYMGMGILVSQVHFLAIMKKKQNRPKCIFYCVQFFWLHDLPACCVLKWLRTMRDGVEFTFKSSNKIWGCDS